MIYITPHITINADEIQEEFIRASGPGGQNVNKVSSAVLLRFDVHNSSLPHDVRERLLRLAANRINEDGVLLLKSQSFRTQERNRRDALERLVQLIREAATPPKVRHKTKPTQASQRRRLQSKRRHSVTKALRRAVPRTDE
ncbi:MAG TPA: alternative ribosome rescue aminoacyl-tRNA hydrolase ArfB [Abditibacteriaceae bacterium]|nr:alternative ribosome rescue aminoacyl-tRNA hydrolase ArfB [Abditibacteriaceae bacterium]